MTLFTLIKNELIKITKRAKTWIVFGLFLICIIGTMFLNHYSDKTMRYHSSPEGRIEQLNHQKEYLTDNIKRAKEYNDEYSKQEILESEKQLKEVEEDIKLQEERKGKKEEPDIWKSDLINEKKELQNLIDDTSYPERYKTYQKERMEEIDNYLNKDIKPVETWEFNAINYGRGFIETIGLIILVLGIAVFMSDIVSGESTPATLKFLLVQPISRGKVVLSKFIAVTLTVVVMICGLEMAAFGAVGLVKGFDGASMSTKIGVQHEWVMEEGATEEILSVVENSGVVTTRLNELVQSFGLQILFIIACCALVLLVSILFKSSMIAMAVSLIISVVGTVLCMMSSLGRKVAHLIFLNYGNTTSVVSGDVAYMFQNPQFSVALGVGLMCSTIIACLALSYIIFNKKDILI